MKGRSLAMLAALAIAGGLPLASAGPSERSLRETLAEPLRAEASATWEALDPKAVGDLKRIAESRREPLVARHRAIRALGWAEGNLAVQALKDLASSKKLEAPLRAEAAAALERRVEEGSAELQLLLDSEDERMREVVVRTLVRAGGDQARLRLEERVGAEPVIAVRESMQRGLTTLEP